MKNFILSADQARIIEAVPQIKEFLLPSELLIKFPQIKEMGMLKMKNIVPGSLDFHLHKGIEICYVHDGNYIWNVGTKEYKLYPGNCFITCPWEMHGSPKGTLDIGYLSWIILMPDLFRPDTQLIPGSWSSISDCDLQDITKAFKNNKKHHSFTEKRVGSIFQTLYQEITEHNLGYFSRVNQLLDELLILTARGLNREYIPENSESGISTRLKKQITNNLAHDWSIVEMAELLSLRLTRLNEIVKKETGFSPHQYLITLRIDKAKNLLKRMDYPITQIALECGFYSSQHFAGVFKKRTGVSPREYRKTLQI